MSFAVNLATVAKRRNSTMISSGSSFSGSLKSGSSILHPSIDFNFNADGGGGTAAYNPSGFNHAYIPLWDRYYWIDSWVWGAGLWTAVMSVDVLATYRTKIQQSQLYILRSATQENLEIMDTAYPATANTVNVHTDDTFSTWTDEMDSGTFMLRMQGRTGLVYYPLSKSDLLVVFNALYPELTITNWYEVLNDYLNAQDTIGGIENATDYIQSIMYFPFAKSNFQRGSAQEMYAGSYKIGVTSAPLTDTETVFTDTAVFSRLSGEDRFNAAWVCCKPYARHTLELPPFGAIDVDGLELLSNTSGFQIDAEVTVNGQNGAAILRLLSGVNQQHCFAEYSAQCGYSYGFTTGVSDIANAALSAIPSIAGGAANIAAGRMATGSYYLLSGLTSFYENSLASPTRGGSGNGSPTPRIGKMCTDSIYWLPVDEDREHIGRPYCAIDNPGSGFNKVADGRLELEGAYPEEIDAVADYLEEGFFFE